MKKKLSFFVFIFSCSWSIVFAQTVTNPFGSNWMIDLRIGNAFIENIGQFDLKKHDKNETILFGVDGSVQILFTAKGLQYNIKSLEEMTESEAEKVGEKQRIDEDEETLPKFKAVFHPFSMEWVGSNPACELIATDKMHEFWIYPDAENNKQLNANGYKRLVYKNIYPNIDVEYIISPKGGVKYSIILFPGADPSVIQMKFHGDMELALQNGDLLISGRGTEIIEHAPVAFYQMDEKPLKSSYKRNGRIVSFELEDYDLSKTVIIDPWIQTGATESCTPYQLEKDAANNTYVYAFYGQQGVDWSLGQAVVKINAAGIIQWNIHPGWLAGTPWSKSSGDLAVDNGGNVYFTNHFGGTTTSSSIMRVNSSGVVQYTTLVSSASYESSRLTFNCDQSALICSGTISCCNNGNSTSINQATGSASNLFTYNGLGDLRSSCFGNNGYLYQVSTSPGSFGNPALAPSARLIANNSITGYSTVFNLSLNKYIAELPSTNYGSCVWCNPTVFNATATSCNHLYVYLGDTLQQRDLLSGALLNTVSVQGGNFMQNMGIATDQCGNIYVGSSTGVHIYDQTLSLLASFPTPFKVLDVLVGTGNTFYACGGTPGQFSGTSFVQQFSYTPTCPPPLTITVDTAGCTLASATAHPQFCSPPYTYLWSNGQTTQTVTGLNAGTYSVIVTGAGTCAMVDTAEVIIPSTSGTLNTTSSQIDATCGTTGSATITPAGGTAPYTYVWSDGQTTATATDLIAGTYTVIVTDSTGCSQTTSFTIAGNSSIDISTSQVNASCSSLGSATVTATGGIEPYTYNWSNGQTTAISTNLEAGTYSVIITDSTGCTQTNTITILSTGGLSLAITSQVNANCSSPGTATVTATGGIAPYTYNWSNGQTTATATDLVAGTYTVIATDSTDCTQDTTITILSTGGLSLTIASQTNVSCYGHSDGSATISSNGGTAPYSYNWSPNASTTATAENLSVGTYTVHVSDLNGCADSLTLSIQQPDSLQATGNVMGTTCGNDNGSATIIPTGGTIPYSYNWLPNVSTTSNATNLSAGSYTVTITDGNGCTNDLVVDISGSSMPDAAFTFSPVSACDTACVVLSAEQSGLVYNWVFSNGMSSSLQNPTPCFTESGSYNATLTVTDATGCSATFTQTNVATVYPAPTASFTISPVSATIYNPTITFINQSTGATNWIWQFDDENNSSSTLEDPVFTYHSIRSYCPVLQVSNEYGCVDSAVACIEITDEFVFYAPNAFTPDNSGPNDGWLPVGVGIDEYTYEMMIFDRWGNLIWESHEWGQAWDGKIRNGNQYEIAKQDIYVWKCQFRDKVYGKYHLYNGHISLLK